MKSSVARFVLVALLLCGLIAFAVDENGDTAQVDDALPSRVERLRGLAEVWGMVHYFHPALADEGRKAAWEAQLLLAISRVESANTNRDYAAALQEMIARLGDVETSILMPGEIDEFGRPSIGAPSIRLQQHDDRVFITEVARETSAKDLTPGMELVAVDDVKVSDWLEFWLPFASGRTEAERRQWVFDRMLSGSEGEILCLLVDDAMGNTFSVDLESRIHSMPVAEAPALHAETVGEGRFLYLQFTSLLRPMATFADIAAMESLVRDFRLALAQSVHEGLILDLRVGLEGDSVVWGEDAVLLGILGAIDGSQNLLTAGYAQRIHRGLACARYPWLSNEYGELWAMHPGVSFSEPTTPLWKKPLVILVDRGIYPHVFECLVPLQASGNAVIVGDEGSSPSRKGYACELPGGYGFRLRLTVPWFEHREASLQVRAVSPTLPDLESQRDVGLQRALEILGDWDEFSRAESDAAPAVSERLLLPGWSIELSGEREVRLLGLFRLWNAIRYFYPFPEMIDGDWNTILEEFIPRVEEAENRTAYYHELQHLLARINDGHAILSAGYPAGYRPPVEVIQAEGEFVIAAVDADANTRSDLDGLEVGMIIKTIACIVPSSTSLVGRVTRCSKSNWSIQIAETILL